MLRPVDIESPRLLPGLTHGDVESRIICIGSWIVFSIEPRIIPGVDIFVASSEARKVHYDEFILVYLSCGGEVDPDVDRNTNSIRAEGKRDIREQRRLILADGFDERY